MSQVKLKFNLEENNIKDKIFMYDTNLTFEEMLTQFLRETNSKQELNPNKITFLRNGHILNSPTYLHKKLSSVFTKLGNIYTVQVSQNENIIGGNYKILLFISF